MNGGVVDYGTTRVRAVSLEPRFGFNATRAESAFMSELEQAQVAPTRADRLHAGPGAWLAASMPRLWLAVAASSSAVFVYAYGAEWAITKHSAYPILNIVAIAFQLLLVVIAGYTSGILSCSLLLGERWRRRALLNERVVDDHDTPDIRSFSEGSGFVGFAALLGCAAFYGALHVASDDWIGEYNRSGAYVSMLRSSDEGVRVGALKDLVHPIREGDSSSESVRFAVRDALADPSPAVQLHAAWACGHLVIVDCQPGLLRLLVSDNGEVFDQAALALGRMRDVVGERRMLEMLPAVLGDDGRARALITGLGLYASVEGAEQLSSMLGLLPAHIEAIALWAIGRARITSVRARVLSLDPGDDLARRCAVAEALKHVSTIEDDAWLRELFVAEPRGLLCVERGLRDIEFTEGRRRDDIVYVVGEDLREKHLRAVFNIAGPRLEPWLQEIVYDEGEDLTLRLLAERMLKLLDGAPARLPRE